MADGTELKHLLENETTDKKYDNSVYDDYDGEEKNKKVQKDRTKIWNKIKGIIAMVITELSVTASATSVQLLERRVPDFELNAFRAGTALFFDILFLLCMKKWPSVPRSEVLVVFACAVLSSVTPLLYYISVTFASLTSVMAIEVTSSLVAGIPLFAVMLKEEITVKRLLFAGFCICGVILITQPQFIFKQKELDYCNETMLFTDNFSNNVNITAPHCKMENKTGFLSVYVGYGLSAISGLGIILNLFLIKNYTYLNENIDQVLFWQFVIGTFVSVIIMAIYETPVLINDTFQGTLIAIHSLSYTLLWPMFLYASRHISANTVNIFWSTPVVLSLAMQYTVLSSIQPGNRNWMEVIGAALVLLGSALGSVWEILRSE